MVPHIIQGPAAVALLRGISGSKNSEWKNNLKEEISVFLDQRGLSYKGLINVSSIKYIEQWFPNICSVLRRIEENF